VHHLLTPRLRLDAVVPADLDDLYALMSDAGTWAHLPSGRHTSVQQTAAGIEHSVRHWSRDGLGYWAARLRDDGSVVGNRRLRRPRRDDVVEPLLPLHAVRLGPRPRG
jgi:RimJ/RimL family protein N-acetyltransferase